MADSREHSKCASIRLFAVAVAIGLLAAPLVLAAEAERPVSFARAGGLAAGDVAAWSSPRVDVPRLLEEDAAVAGKPGIPLRVGYPMAADLEPRKSGTWESLGGGDGLWRLRLLSPGALWMVLGFDAFRLQDGGRMWVYDPGRKTVLGPYTTADVRDHGELWTPPVDGGELIVELYWPAKLGSEAPRIHLGTVSHGYKPFGAIGRAAWLASKGYETTDGSGSCNIDVNCPLGADWQDEKRGVVILLSGGSSFCTGSMINNTKNDCAPYVLTAAHCTAGASTQFGFNYERSGCGAGDPPDPTTYMVSGATVRGNYASSDFTLLEMSGLPPQSFDFYLSGWSRDPNPATMTWVIHHPNGDFKKISYDADPPGDGSHYGANHWRIEDYEQGTTEPGSSGSPLFDQNSRIVGQLHGGTASCTSDTYDEYGKVSESWTGGGTAATRLSDWLDPLNTGVLFSDGLNGSTCFFQPAGAIALGRSRYACADTVVVRLRDDNLRGSATQAVTIASTTESVPETLLLAAVAPGSGEFEGTIPTVPGTAAHGDGKLSVSHGDAITATYIDADDGAGGTNLVRTATATVDCAPPSISSVHSADVTGSTARIVWTTDEPADSRVRYGTAIPPTSSAFAAPLATSHSVTLSGLTECAHYVYSVESADAVANLATDDAAGGYYAFDTLKNTTPSYPSTGSPLAIPDSSATGVTSTIAVAETKTVLEVKVEVNITHTYDGDLELTLVAPNGTAIPLATRRGSGGANFTNTVFDDAAATAISAGTAPFTGSYRPESPLSAAVGIGAAGNWQLKVADRASSDTGTLDNWTLTLRYAAAACGPHAKLGSHAPVQDLCAAGGPGSGDGTWDAGETVQFSVTLENDGSRTLTGVTATLVPATPGVTMLTAAGSFPDIAPAGSAISSAPHFKAALPASLACGGTVAFDVLIGANEGSWTDGMTHLVGRVIPGGGTPLNETFASGIPGSWTVVDGGSGGGAAATWTASNPGSRSATAPLVNPLAIVDSDNAGTGATQDEQLITLALDLSATTAVTLEFDQYFRWYSGGQAETGDVDVRSSLTGNAWVNVLRNQGVASADPDHKTVNITAQSAGAANVQVRFHYYNASYEWYWQVDNVKVTTTAPGGCAMNVCLAPPSAPPPVPDGSFGTPARASLAAADGSSIELAWDASTCVAGDYHVLYGPLAGLPTYAVAGGVCDLGASGAYAWTTVPSGDLWFVIVGDDDATTEGSWGLASSGPIGGTTASGVCSMAARNNAGTCP